MLPCAQGRVFEPWAFAIPSVALGLGFSLWTRGSAVSPERIERKLVAILAADIAGYSRLMGVDEVGTARALREHRAAVDPIMASHGGRIVKTTGDGVLLQFPSVVAAVECAVAVQNLMAERNADVPQDRRMLFRMGINLGDVLIEDDDILGDGVNIAARLEGIAEPGGRSTSKTWVNSSSRISPGRYACIEFRLAEARQKRGLRSRCRTSHQSQCFPSKI